MKVCQFLAEVLGRLAHCASAINMRSICSGEPVNPRKRMRLLEQNFPSSVTLANPAEISHPPDE